MVKRFIWLQDLDFVVEGGGAQNTDRMHFMEGIRRGHNQSLVVPGGDSGTLMSDNALVLISNAALFGVELFREFLDKKRPYVWFVHDYWPICKYRLYYPMLEKCKSCYKRETWLPIMMGAKLIIWLSPLHRESWMWTCPELKDVPYALVPSPIDVEQFYNMGLPREGVVSVNSLVDFKGKDNVIKWSEEHPGTPVTFVGGSDGQVSLPGNCSVVGTQSFWEMNRVYNQHKVLLHLPGTPQPFERIVAEAYLAGCDIIGNVNIGALSYDWFRTREQVAKHCGNSSKLFWEKIEEVLT